MSDKHNFTDRELADAIQSHLYHEGYERVDTYNGSKIIANDRGAHYFDTVFNEALNILLYGKTIDDARLPSIKAMVENLHNTIVDLDNADVEKNDETHPSNTPFIN